MIFIYFTHTNTKELLFLMDTLPQKVEIKLTNGIEEGKQAPNFLLSTTDGDFVSLKNLNTKHKVFLITASSCSACSLDIIDFIEASQKYPDYHFILINKEDETHEIVNKYPKDSPCTRLIANPEFLKAYNIKLFPTFMIIDKEDRIVGYPKVINHFEYYFKKMSNAS